MVLNTKLTSAMKNTITQLRLIDTGALLASAEVYVNDTGTSLILEVRSEDYIKYHVYSSQITEIFLTQTGVNDEINVFLIPQIEKAIQKTLDGQEAYLAPELYITYNDGIL